MPLNVTSFTPYVSLNAGLTLSQHEWNAFKLIQALKGKAIKGFANIPLSGMYFELRQENAHLAVEWFARMASQYILQKQVPAPLVFIPIPNSSCTADCSTAPRTVTLAQAVAEKLRPTSVVDCLRWQHAMGSASTGGGPRRPQTLYDSLVLTDDVPKQGTFILIDDMKTTGGHLQACRAMIESQGVTCDMAICGGRTVWDHNQQPFTMAEEEIDDWGPTGTFGY
jgi:hypothetical protein